MAQTSSADDDVEIKGGLSRHDVGVISVILVLAIGWTVGTLIFGWHFDPKRAGLTALLLVAFWWVGNASERAENRERRLRRIERKLDKALEYLQGR